MIRFTEQQPETFTLAPQSRTVPSPFVFHEETPEDINTVLQKRESKKQIMRQSLIAKEDIPVTEDIERLDTEIKNAQTDKEVERLEGEVATLKEQIRTMELARGPKGNEGKRGPAGKSVDVDAVVSEVAKKVEKKLPTVKDLIKLIRPLIPEPEKGEKGSDGKNGSPDTPEQIKEKITTLEVKDRWFDWEHLKNIPKEIFEKGEEGWVGGYGALDFDLKTVTLAPITSNQNDYSLGYGAFFRISSDASRTITGFEGGKEGRSIVLVNVGSNNIVLANQNASSGGINRIITGTGASMTLAADDVAILTYDNVTERWRVWESTPTGSSPDVTTESLTPTASGDNITLDLTGLSNTLVSLLLVMRNGQIQSSGTAAGSDGSSRYQLVGSTVTVFNATDSDVFQVTYTF